MKSLLLKVFGVVAFTILFAAPAQAQATRTWVSGVGDDANPCSRTAPCKTFAGAISKTATGGEINCLDPAGFGAVNITKAMSIDCTGTLGGILAAGTNGVTVNITTGLATDVVFLNGLDINGAGTGLNGIRFLAGKALHIKNSVVRNFLNEAVQFTPASGETSLVIEDSSITDTSAGTGGGVRIAPTAGNTVATLTNVHLDRNKFGLKVLDRSTVVLNNSTTNNNFTNGVVVNSTGSVVKLSVVNSTISGNVTGAATSGVNANIYLAYSTVMGNTTGVSTAGLGTIFGTNPQTNVIFGNGSDGVTNGIINLALPVPAPAASIWW